MREKHQLSWGEPGLRLDPDGNLVFILRQCLTIDSTLFELRVNPFWLNLTSDSNLNLGCSIFSRFDGETSSKRRLFTVFRVSWVGSWDLSLFLSGVESDKNPESSLNPSTTISIYILSLYFVFFSTTRSKLQKRSKYLLIASLHIFWVFSLFRHWKKSYFESWFWGGGHTFLRSEKSKRKIMPLSVRKDLAQKVNEVDVIREGKLGSKYFISRVKKFT